MLEDQELPTKIKPRNNMLNENSSFTNNDIESKLLLPCTHISQVSGKGHEKIVRALNHWLQISDDKMNNIIEVLNLLHVGSLLVDDIQDNTNMRRGVPTAHRVYGVPMTINASFHVQFLAINKAYEIDHRIPEILLQDLLKAYRGQGLDIYWRDNFICPTEDQYKEMVLLKTGSFFIGAYRLLQLFSENKTDYSKLLTIIGSYFQIRDDYCNLVHPEAELGMEESPRKPDEQDSHMESSFCDDITEGKFSFPVVHALQKPQGGEILNILRQRTKDVTLKKYFVSLLKKLGSLQYTREVMEKMDHEARAEISKFGGNPLLEAVLDDLCKWKVD